MERQAKAMLLQQRQVVGESKAAAMSNGAGSGTRPGRSSTEANSPPPEDQRSDGASTALLVGGVVAAGAVLALGILTGGDKVKEIAADEIGSSGKSTRAHPPDTTSYPCFMRLCCSIVWYKWPQISLQQECSVHVLNDQDLHSGRVC
jgi:hypothetical protein